MNSKERVKAAVRHEETDRIPIDFIAREEVIEALSEHFGTCDGETLLRRLSVDLRGVGPRIKRQASPVCYADPTVWVEKDVVSEQPVYFDIWGVGFVQKKVVGGTYVDLFHSPLKKTDSPDDLARYPFPTPDLWDYSGLPDQIERHKDSCVWIHSRGFFEIAWFMRGMEEFLIDLMVNSEYAETLMDRIAEYLTGRTVRMLEMDKKGLIDFVEINDDVGGQGGLLISPALWREFFKPRMAAMIARFKKYGKLIRYHSCGGIREIIPDLIEIGVDILNPVQPLARGMALDGLKRDFGHSLAFDGGIDTQELLPHKRGKDFEREARETLRLMARNGGYIMAPSHALQVDVPLENVLTLYRLASLPTRAI